MRATCAEGPHEPESKLLKEAWLYKVEGSESKLLNGDDMGGFIEVSRESFGFRV